MERIGARGVVLRYLIEGFIVGLMLAALVLWLSGCDLFGLDVRKYQPCEDVPASECRPSLGQQCQCD